MYSSAPKETLPALPSSKDGKKLLGSLAPAVIRDRFICWRQQAGEPVAFWILPGKVDPSPANAGSLRVIFKDHIPLVQTGASPVDAQGVPIFDYRLRAELKKDDEKKRKANGHADADKAEPPERMPWEMKYAISTLRKEGTVPSQVDDITKRDGRECEPWGFRFIAENAAKSDDHSALDDIQNLRTSVRKLVTLLQQSAIVEPMEVQSEPSPKPDPPQKKARAVGSFDATEVRPAIEHPVWQHLFSQRAAFLRTQNNGKNSILDSVPWAKLATAASPSEVLTPAQHKIALEWLSDLFVKRTDEKKKVWAGNSLLKLKPDGTVKVEYRSGSGNDSAAKESTLVMRQDPAVAYLLEGGISAHFTAEGRPLDAYKALSDGDKGTLFCLFHYLFPIPE